MGKPLSGGGFPRTGAVGGLQESQTERLYRKISCGGGAASRQLARGNGHGRGHRGRHACWHRLFHDVRRKRAEGNPAAVDELWFRRGITCNPRRLSEIQSASARLRQFCPAARQIRAGREDNLSRRSGAPPDFVARRELEIRPSWSTEDGALR